MYRSTHTTSNTLEVDCLPIYIIHLTRNGLMPSGRVKGVQLEYQEELFTPHHLPPVNPTEETLLSIWINTHQAMFMTTGISAYCVNQATHAIKEGVDKNRIIKFIEFAKDCRLSSAAYTSLPLMTRGLYESYIRESMRQVSPGFSGVSNREAIAMEVSLRELKNAQIDMGYRNKKLADCLHNYLEQLYIADKKWWRHHGAAMSKLVTNPVSLARMDFKRQTELGSKDKNFNDYRDNILRTSQAKSDYDEYFAVRRSDEISLQCYQSTLNSVLERSSQYVDTKGELAVFRENGEQALKQVIDFAASELAD